jgi:uncharacterized repeat protein (TIGR03803 family)
MQLTSRIGSTAVRLIMLSLALSTASLVCANPAQAWTFKMLYQFGGNSDGAYPWGGLLRDEVTGDLFGVTYEGGDANCNAGRGCGVVFRLSSGGKLSVLHTFSKYEEGLYPVAGLIEDEEGDLYGTTNRGGMENCPNTSDGCGVVFELATNGKYKVLHIFDTAVDGGVPHARFVRNSLTGDIYGVADYGATYRGEFFKISRSGKFTYRLLENGNVQNALLLGPDGKFYVAAEAGAGECNCGEVLRLSPKGKDTVLYTFTKRRASYPGSLAVDGTGQLYGTGSGKSEKHGAVFRLSADGAFSMLHVFSEPDGTLPEGDIVVDASGTIFGTTWYGGDAGHGVIFQLNPDQSEQVLYSFPSSAVARGLIADKNGNLYGETSSANGYGTVYELVK